MKIVAPPRHTPVSIRSPGTSSRITVSMQCWMFSMRRSPIIESALAGQSRPIARISGSYGFL
jgi:hypothetical protein